MTGEDIAEVRKGAGLTQVEFARRLGIHSITLSVFENDRDPIPLYIQLAVPELERILKSEGYPKVKPKVRQAKKKPAPKK